MIERAGRVLEAVDQLYLAGLGQVTWPEAMKAVADACGGVGGVTFDMDRENFAFARWDAHGLEPDGSDYQTHLNSINPRMHASLAEPEPHLMWDYRFTDESGMSRHEFYDWLNVQDRLRYFVGGRIDDRGSVSTFASVEFTARHGHPDRDTIETFGLLARHLDAARRLDANTGTTLDLVELAPDGHADAAAAMAIDRKGRIVQLNAAADDLVLGGGLLDVRRGRPVFQSPRLNGAFAVRLELICRGDEMARAVANHPIRTRAASHRPGYMIRLLPVPGAVETAAPERIAAILLIERAELSGEQLVATLRDRFAASRREAELAVAIRNKASLPAAATHLGISANTARVHLQNLFAKCGLHSQIELVLMVERLARA